MPTLHHPPLVALVTGATAGLGKAIALRLARDGVHVTVVGRDADRGAAVVAQIKEAGGQARFIAADLSDPASIKHLVEEVGQIDILINNAGRSVWAMLLMLMMLPAPRSAISGATAPTSRYGARTLLSVK